MAYFTEEEFHKMLTELSEGNPDGYATLYFIAEKTVKKTVYRWCAGNKMTRGYEEDVMQEVHLRLIKKCITGFLKKDGVLNDDPEGFKNWMFKVARNIYIDFAKKISAIPLDITDTSDEDATEPEIEDSDNELYNEDDYDYDALNSYFEFVFESSSEIHIVMTWVAVMLAVIRGGLNRSEATVYVTSVFSNATMDELLDFIVKGSEKVLWLNIDEDLIGRIKSRLDKTDSEGRRTGSKKYGEFYMKKGDRASVSDWVNRMNERIIKEADNDDASYN